MDKAFEKWRPGRRRRGEAADAPVAFRITRAMRAEIEAIAAMEDDDLTGIFIEGCARVIEERRKDPNYAAKIAEGQRKALRELAEETEARHSILRELGIEIPPTIPFQE